jgi:hypothetical protein
LAFIFAAAAKFWFFVEQFNAPSGNLKIALLVCLRSLIGARVARARRRVGEIKI